MNKSKLFILIKHHLFQDWYQFLVLKKFKKIEIKKVFTALVSILVMVYLYATILFPPLKLTLLEMFNQKMYSEAMLCVATIIFLFNLLSSIPITYSFFEKNDDVISYLHLPIKMKTLLHSKIISFSITTIITSVFLLLATIIAQIEAQIPIYVCVISFIFFILIEIELVYFASIISFLLHIISRCNKFIKKFYKFISILFILVLFGGYLFLCGQYGASISSDGTIQNPISMLVVSLSNQAKAVKPILFFISWFSNVGIDNLLNAFISLFFGVLFTSLFIFITDLLAKKFMYNFIFEKDKELTHTTKAQIDKENKKVRKKSHFTILFLKEFKNLYSNTTYILTALMPDFMIVFMIAISLFVNGLDLNLVTNELNNILSLFSGFEKYTIFIAIGCALGLITGYGNIISSTISREGLNFWILAKSPVKYSTQVLAKIVANQIVHCLVYSVLIILFMFFIRIDIIYYFIMLISSIISCFIIGAYEMLFSFISPKFDYKNPKEAVNSGFGALFSMLGVVSIAVFIGFISFIASKINLSLNATIIAIINIYLIIGIASFSLDCYLFKKICRKY